MRCSKCGIVNSDSVAVCVNCGTSLKEIVTNENVEQIAKPVKEAPVNGEALKTKARSNYKKPILIVIFILILVLVGCLIYIYFFDSGNLSWDESYEYANLEYISPSELKLGVKFSNKEKIGDIKYETTCGELEVNGLDLTWNLTEAIGKCEITASYKLKSIKRTVTVIKDAISFEEDKYIEYKIDEDSDEDLDYDGLTNKQEKEYKTNPEVADTDHDGLSDYDEVITHKTDPNIKDTDSDGLSDYDEIQLMLDPLKKDSKNDGVKDGDRELHYNIEKDNVKISIAGKGNIASTVSSVTSSTKISEKKGLIDKLYSFHTDGTISEATVTISYTDEELSEFGLNEDNLSFYYYNPTNSKYEKVESTVNKSNKTVTAKIKHFSIYVVGDSSLINENVSNEVLFVLDNSWSLYTNAQYEQYTGKEYSGGWFESSKLDGFDEKGIRFEVTGKLADRLSAKGHKIGLSEFRSDYANAYPIGTDAKIIKDKLSNMMGNFITKSAGTNISNALYKGMEEFSDTSDNKFIVLLTDGHDGSLKSQIQGLVKEALKSDVKICSVGFGDGAYNEQLAEISESTKCAFYSSSDAMGLVELFDNIATELDDGLVDVDGDNKNDGVMIADSGFIVNRDGFSFRNYTSNKTGGHCFGMATFAELYYKKVLPLRAESIYVKANGPLNDGATSYAYDLTNTDLKDHGNLYDYRLKTKELKYFSDIGWNYFGETQPVDYKYIKGDVLSYNDEYRSAINSLKIYEITTSEKPSSLSEEESIKKYGGVFGSYERVIINEDVMQDSDALDDDDIQLFNAIYALFIKQKQDVHISSSWNFTLVMRNLFGTEPIHAGDGYGFMELLKDRLNDKDPVVLNANFGGGLHAINAINLIQDIDNPQKYYIGVYDNNYPGEKRYLQMECGITGWCSARANEFYSATKEPVRITRSLEDDLKYFNSSFGISDGGSYSSRGGNF